MAIENVKAGDRVLVDIDAEGVHWFPATVTAYPTQDPYCMDKPWSATVVDLLVDVGPTVVVDDHGVLSGGLHQMCITLSLDNCKPME
jgi:hypothetical protein